MSFLLGLSHGAMTHHFHMRLADEQSRGMEGSYEAWATAGYGQGWTARMAIAERAVAKFLASPAIRSQLAPIGLDDPAVRTLFSYVFWRTLGRAALDLRLQILSMAAQLGEPQHVPGLVDILRSTALRDEERDQILAVIAGITGFDRRPVGGHKRTPDQVVAETRAACGRSP